MNIGTIFFMDSILGKQIHPDNGRIESAIADFQAENFMVQKDDIITLVNDSDPSNIIVDEYRIVERHPMRYGTGATLYDYVVENV